MLTVALLVVVMKLFGIISLSWNTVILIEFFLMIVALVELRIIYRFIDRNTK